MPRHVTPALAVDVIIELVDQPGRPIVVVMRRHPPSGCAIPGGFVNIGETVEQAARREAREETGLEVTLGELLGIYSDPRRDPRGHSVSLVYLATATGQPVAGDDAAGVLVVNPRVGPQVVFDHRSILDDYLRRIEFRS